MEVFCCVSCCVVEIEDEAVVVVADDVGRLSLLFGWKFIWVVYKKETNQKEEGQSKPFFLTFKYLHRSRKKHIESRKPQKRKEINKEPKHIRKKNKKLQFNTQILGSLHFRIFHNSRSFPSPQLLSFSHLQLNFELQNIVFLWIFHSACVRKRNRELFLGQQLTLPN